ncbi:MAG: hypothetical protein WC768_04860 [Patescibacteria group bacterium]|jgi:hypothetical protein
MANSGQNKTDDFFSSISNDQKIENPFATDEIFFRDEKGDLKILKGGQVLDYDLPPKPAQPVVKPEIPAAPVVVQKLMPIAEKPQVKPAAPVSIKPIPAGTPLNIDKEMEIIVKEAGINFSAADSERKFRNIVASRLKEVRDPVQLRDVLLSSTLVGGMGFDTQTADRVLAIVNREFQRLHGNLRDNISTEPFSDLRQEADKILAEPEIKPEVVFRAEAEEEQIIAKPEPVPVPPTPELAAEEPVNFSRPVASPPTGKPVIEDVRFKPKLVGPVEEIRSMTLTDFRRLAPTPEQAIEKVLQKINLLEEESFARKTQGIAAWKENEIYRLYLDLGDQSMAERKPIADIILERQQANAPALTEEELEAIMELNQKLRY